MVVLIRLLRLPARVLREAVPLVVGELLYLAAPIVRADEAAELVALARDAAVLAAVPLGDDFLDETQVAADVVSKLARRGRAGG